MKKTVLSISTYLASVYEVNENENGEITCVQAAPAKVESSVAVFGVNVRVDTPADKVQYETASAAALRALLTSAIEKVDQGNIAQDMRAITGKGKAN